MTQRFSPLAVSADARTGFPTLTPGTRGGTGYVQQTLTYGPSIAWELRSGLHGIVTITDAVAFVLAAPTFGGVALSAVAPFTSMAGLRIALTYRNTSGGAHGAGTFNAIFKTSGNFAAIATATNRTICFEWNGANFIELWRTAADVAN